MRAMYLTGTIKATNNARTQMLLELKKAAAHCDRYSQTSPSSVLDHFDSVTEMSSAGKNRQTHLRSEIQLRLYRARKKALHLYKERIR